MSALNAILKAIKRIAPTQVDPAMQRAEQLSQLTDLSRYSPSTIARSTTFSPAAQRGFSESLVSSRAPFGATLIRPSEWAEHTPSLTEGDDHILEYLTQSLKKDKLKEAPILWIDEYPNPSTAEAGYEGRHRMEALRRLYGDDPVLTNLIRGDRFNLVTDSPYYPKGTTLREYSGPSTTSPLELLQQQIMFGDIPYSINPLWVKE